jgi:hypothetical protein
MAAPDPPIEYLDFALHLEPLAAGEIEVRVSSPAGEDRERIRLPFTAAELDGLAASLSPAVRGAQPPGAGAVRDACPPPGMAAARDPLRTGEELGQALLSGRVLELYRESLGLVRGKGLRLRIHLDLARPEAARLGGVPWELIRPAGREPLSLSLRSPIVRYLEAAGPVLPAPFEGPLRILVVVASPRGYAPLDLPRERARILENWGARGGVEVDFLEAPSLRRLSDSLLARTRHVIHFMGHGCFEPASGAGALVFEGEHGEPELVRGEALAARLPAPRQPLLVVLNACDTARQTARDGVDPFAGVAAALVKGGLLAVVAMQFPVSDAAALAFSDGLYRSLALGSGLEAAVTVGRLAIAEDPGSFEWATPALFLRTARAVELPFVTPRAITEQIRDAAGYIAEKTAGFVGRKFVFAAIDRFVEERPRGYFFVRGDPGIGKTAFLARMVQQHGYVHHFNIRTRNVVSTFDFLCNVCARLIAAYRLEHAALPPEATRDSGFLLALLEAISRRGQPGRKVVLLIDALDESDRSGLAPGANTLCLPESLPAGVYVVATTRREGEANLPLRIDCEQTTLFLDSNGADNLADVEEFVAGQLGVAGIRGYISAHGLDDETFVAELVGRSEGNFMYLHYVLPEIARGDYTARSLDDIPQGLNNYYQQHWLRMRSRDEESWFACRLPVIMALTVVRQPVPLDLVAECAGVADHRRVHRVLDDWLPFLHAERVREDGQEEIRYRLYHLSFLEFLKSKDEVEVSFKAAHERVMRALAKHI